MARKKVHYSTGPNRYPVCNAGSVLFGPAHLRISLWVGDPAIDCKNCIKWINRYGKTLIIR
jgi:hypothetical protein